MNEQSPEASKSAFAYLQQATVEIAAEQNFKPASESQLMAWINKNSMAISERAGDLQQNFIAKVLAEKKTIFPAVSAVVWGDINKDKIDEDVLDPDNNC
jgi:hypothetical protein